MSSETLRIVPVGPERDAYLPLLYLADDSAAQVHSYYQTGDLYALDDAAVGPLAVVLVIPHADGSGELKAVAVNPRLHRNGIGRRLVMAVLDGLRRRGVQRVIVGTRSSSLGPLAFYQNAGFRFWRIEREYFTPARGYPEGLEEDGIPVRDMVWLDQEL